MHFLCVIFFGFLFELLPWYCISGKNSNSFAVYIYIYIQTEMYNIDCKIFLIFYMKPKVLCEPFGIILNRWSIISLATEQRRIISHVICFPCELFFKQTFSKDIFAHNNSKGKVFMLSDYISKYQEQVLISHLYLLLILKT